MLLIFPLKTIPTCFSGPVPDSMHVFRIEIFAAIWMELFTLGMVKRFKYYPSNHSAIIFI